MKLGVSNYIGNPTLITILTVSDDVILGISCRGKNCDDNKEMECRWHHAVLVAAAAVECRLDNNNYAVLRRTSERTNIKHRSTHQRRDNFRENNSSNHWVCIAGMGAGSVGKKRRWRSDGTSYDRQSEDWGHLPVYGISGNL